VVNVLKTGAIIQTRMGSTRLPGKVMLDLFDRPVIGHVIERVKNSKFIDDIIIATTTLKQDDVIEEQAEKNGVHCFRGSEEDVLSRYYLGAKENNLDVVVRITSDCPLIDPVVTDRVIDEFKKNDYDLVANVGSGPGLRTYPRGLDTEVFSFRNLEEAFINAKEKYQREHVTPYIYENGKKISYVKNAVDYSNYRWTLDTDEDFELISTIYKHLYKGKHDFYLNEIIKLFELYPELSKINSHIEQKKVK
jgi:spore coat polysaccharide biosynthesis protein SpsF